MIFGIYLHYKKILRMWKAYAVRAGRGEEGKKKRKMNIILYYIILYIYIYIDKVVNILQFVQKRGWFLPSVFFFLIASVEAVFAFPHLPRLPLNSRNFANPQCLPNKINNLTKFSLQRSCATLQHPKNSQKTLTKSIT